MDNRQIYNSFNLIEFSKFLRFMGSIDESKNFSIFQQQSGDQNLFLPSLSRETLIKISTCLGDVFQPKKIEIESEVQNFLTQPGGDQA